MAAALTGSPGIAAGVDATEVGAVLAGKYRVERVLGRGGMGLVVEARHLALDERVALKFLLPEFANHAEAAERFLREARAAVKIKTEHVARVTDVGTLDAGEPYMVMEFLEGTDLARLLETKGPLSIEDAVDFVLQGCEAIAEAHSYGIVHRDLKPANLFLTKRPDGTPLVKVLDFGISKNLNAGIESLTRTSASMGSALYMSPEQMQQARSVDHRTDIYALGVSLYELLTRSYPFNADTLVELCARVLTGEPTPLRSIRDDVPEQLAAVIARACERDRSSRFQTIAEFAAALAPFAPQRSQATVDRIARMAGVETSIVGRSPAAPPAAMPSSTLEQTSLAMAQTASVDGSRSWMAGARGAGPTRQFVEATAGPEAAVHESSGQILVPGYAGPVSAKARAAFVKGARAPSGASSAIRALVIAFVLAAALALVGVFAVVALRGRASSGPSVGAQPADAPIVSSAPALERSPASSVVEPSLTPNAAPVVSSAAAPPSAGLPAARATQVASGAAASARALPSTPSSKPTAAPVTRAPGTTSNEPPPIETSR